MSTCSTSPSIASLRADLEQLARFVPAAGRAYANRHNPDHGPDDRGNVSVLSPYICQRLITERSMQAAFGTIANPKPNPDLFASDRRAAAHR
jgi:hypothetical protein